MDYQNNCILIDESAFHINLSCSMTCFKRGAGAVVAQSKARAKTTIKLGKISSQVSINIKMRMSYEQSFKKRKVTAKYLYLTNTA